MRTTSTWLYSSNIKALESAFGRSVEDFSPAELDRLLTWGLGYVDYTKPSVVTDLFKSRRDRPTTRSVEVSTNLDDASMDALRQGIRGLAEDYEEAGEAWPVDWPRDLDDIPDGAFDAMMAYALGFIDYEVLAREYPDN